MITYILGLGAVLLAGASAGAWWRGQQGWAMALLLGAALLLRLLMAGLDPFLHDWDERYHALVARNLMTHPGRPMLRAEPVLPYDYQNWSINHIWLHKQPLFLWQMALSLRAFGVNVLALRLPSALLGTLVLWPVYRLGRLVFEDPLVGYLGAVLATFAYYQLEQVSGAIGMDHNDVAFLVYVTASIWAYYEYRASARPGRWLVLVGVLAGAAVLCKWLPGLLVYAGWGFDLLLGLRQRPKPPLVPELRRLLAALAVTVALVLPWQLYTAWRFPMESAYELAYNARHFTYPVEGHGGPWYYHFRMLPKHYGLVLGLVIVGMGLALRPARRRAALPLLVMVGLIFVFFTLAATKMYSYTYVVSLLLLLLAALPLATAARWLGRQPRSTGWRLGLGGVGLAIVLLADLRPWSIVAYHFQEQAYEMMPGALNRPVREANAALYRQLAQEVPPGYTVVNAPDGSDVEAMFFSGRNVYGSPLSEGEMRIVRARGVKLATYRGTPAKPLPAYLAAPDILQLWGTPQ
ncbi:MAG: ArnT family glycosyltransferase [Janthinobacterium lividum]